jgi:hypothetical protein
LSRISYVKPRIDGNTVDLACYCVRVLEIPTPSWTAYDTKRVNSTMDPEVPMTTQDRAYTRPIWYISAISGLPLLSL